MFADNDKKVSTRPASDVKAAPSARAEGNLDAVRRRFAHGRTASLAVRCLETTRGSFDIHTWIVWKLHVDSLETNREKFGMYCRTCTRTTLAEKVLFFRFCTFLKLFCAFLFFTIEKKS